MSAGNAGRGYEVVPFARLREAVIAVMLPAHDKHNIHVLFEADVTDVRRHLKKLKAETGESLSFTAFIIKCTADAAMTDRRVTACRVSPRKLALFDDVHVITMAETEIDGEEIPFGDLVQRANRKSVREINDQIRRMPEEKRKKLVGGMRMISRVPQGLRAKIMRSLYTQPKSRIENQGTAIVTSVGMFGAGGGHIIPFQAFTLAIGVGGITRKPGIVEDRIEPREFLSVTASFDHDIVDGAPAARFAEELKQRLERGHGLVDTSSDARA